MSTLARKLPSGRTVAEVVMAPFIHANPPVLPRVIDVGARNGMHLLPIEYCAKAELVAFEPNPEEFAKLQNGLTDAAKAGMVEPKFQTTRYFPYALWNQDGDAKFYITVGAGACTMMGHTDPLIGNRMYKRFPATDPRAGHSFLESISHVTEEITVPCKRLDALLDDGETIDILKLDVEGGELNVLKGANSILTAKRVLFIIAEFQTVPYYQKHPLLCDQYAFLKDRGYRLIGLDLNHAQYLREPEMIDVDDDRALLQAGDAIYILDPDTNDLSTIERQRLAVLALIFGFNSLAISLLREAGLTAQQDIDQIIASLRKPPLRRRLRWVWERFPERFAEWLYSFKK